ncbi:hypothetical protein KAJ87_03080 [Candidatus Pacearchaeota archaeon]|nr:hypothetical protein [Candidatus Pacearchaeota archaeon]
MKIYLENRLLVKSKIFENQILEQNKPERMNFSSKRDWSIYTWDSKNKLSFEKDNISGLNKNSIEAIIREYKTYKDHDEFEVRKIPAPDHLIQISGYSSLRNTPKKVMMKLVKELERENIDCLFVGGGAPVIPLAEYISPRLKKKLKHPILEIEL